MRTLTPPGDYTSWRHQALTLLAEGVAPDELVWCEDANQSLLFEPAPANTYASHSKRSPQTPYVSKQFIKMAQACACHNDPGKWDLLYRILWRMTQKKETHLLQLSNDKDTLYLNQLVKNVRRDVHKMHAFVRFRKIDEDPASGREIFMAWFEPEHRIVAYTADFFVKRFHGMDWSIISPNESIQWDGTTLKVGDGGNKADVPEDDAHEALWLSYYKSTFNPARLKLKAMQSEMPKKYWKNLPESELIESLSRDAQMRTDGMLQSTPVPPKSAPKNSYLQSLKKRNQNK